MAKKLLIFVGLVFSLFIFSTNETQAQGQLHCRADFGANRCIIDLSVDPNPSCGPDEEDPCPDGDYNVCCTLQGIYDSGGTLVECQNIACIDAANTPTPAPECPTDWNCINAPQADCDGINGEFRACSDGNGNPGTCCEPPPQTNSPCTIFGGLCRPPSEQSTPGECEWNETEIQRECLASQYPDGTLCCDPAPIAVCGTGQLDDGYCADANDCTSPHSGLTDCEASGQICCLPSPAYVNNQKIFCDANGDPTGDPITGQIYTGFGCIEVETISEFTQTLLRLGIGIGGGLALFLMGLSGILIKLSSGNPERVQTGKELFFAALTGLLLVIFSVFILRLFGVQALAIPNL